MRFSVQLPTDRVERGPEFCSAAAIAEMARGIQDAGFDACYVTEHPFPPDTWLAAGGHHALDPFVALAAAAAATETLRLHTNVVVLAYRNPFLTAKAIASLDVVSGGRVIAGVAAGYLEDEFRAVGADFERRNELTDDALVAMQRAWSGESVRLRARGYEVSGNTMLPRPIQTPHPPIWVGGNTRRAMRRAVQYGRGWSPFPVAARFSAGARTAAIEDISGLASKIRWLRAEAQRVGRSDELDINFVPFGHGMNAKHRSGSERLLEQLAGLAAVGVNWVSLGVSGRTRGAFLENVGRFGEDVIAKLR